MTAKISYAKQISAEMRRIMDEKLAEDEDFTVLFGELRQEAIAKLYVDGIYKEIPF